MKTISKELFIMTLLVMIVIFMIGMIFYKYMPNNRTVPEPITYTADSSTTALLQEISASSGYNYYNDQSEVEDIIKSYSVGAKELSTAASKRTYVSGKTDPFAEYKEADTNSVNSNTVGDTSATNSNSQADTSINNNSSSTGSFFENKNSK